MTLTFPILNPVRKAGHRSRRALLLPFAFLLFNPCQGQAADSLPIVPGTVIRIVDGDTAKVRLQNQVITVRLHGIDAPERDQAVSAAATKALRTLIEGTEVELQPVEQDQYDRLVARVYVDGVDVNAAMIQQGYAWAYRQYLGDLPSDENYCQLEAEARAAGRGLWVGPGQAWVPPWDHRHRRRGDKVEPRDYSRETARDCMAAIRAARRGASHGNALPQADGTDCRIKGNINSKGERIYHRPSDRSYAVTKVDKARGERWFCTEEEARAAGWRPPKQD